MLRQKVAPFAESLVDHTPLINSKTKIGRVARVAIVLAIVTPGSCVGMATCGSYLASKFTEKHAAKAEADKRNPMKPRIESILQKAGN